jgi:hypothetical protein
LSKHMVERSGQRALKGREAGSYSICQWSRDCGCSAPEDALKSYS